MSSQDERQLLIALETEAQETTEELTQKEAELQRLLSEVEQGHKARTSKLQQIREARERLAREEAIEASREQHAEVDSRLSMLRRKYERRAEGKPWADGIFPFQMEGAMFGAAAGRWILADEMGLGKTRQAIGWLDLVGAKKVLIVCEANICSQFAGEVMELAPHREVIDLSKKTPATRAQLVEHMLSLDECVVVVNFEVWRRDEALFSQMLGYQFDTLIVDEGHNLKTTATSNFKHIEALVKADNLCPECGAHIYGLYDADKKPRLVPKPCTNCGWDIDKPQTVRKVYPLDMWLSTKSLKNLCFTTGTPLLNSPMDLYSLLHLCDPKLFKTKSGFKKNFCITNPHSGKTVFRDGQLANLKPLIEGRFLSRTKADVGIVLPAQHPHVVRVDIDPEQYPLQLRTIQQVTETAQIVLDSGEKMTILDVMALITRKRQANVWPGGIQMKDAEGNVIFSVGDEVRESAKLDAVLAKVLELHAEGRRQVVFSQFTTAIDELAARMREAGLRVATMTGKTTETMRKRIKSNFYRDKGEEPEWDIVLCHYKTGGTGLNLTAATATHILDEEWNPGKRDQAYGRTNRIGQEEENDVFVYRVPASVDTWMAQIIRRKEEMVKGFLGTMTEAPEIDQASLLKAMRDGDIL